MPHVNWLISARSCVVHDLERIRVHGNGTRHGDKRALFTITRLVASFATEKHTSNKGCQVSGSVTVIYPPLLEFHSTSHLFISTKSIIQALNNQISANY